MCYGKSKPVLIYFNALTFLGSFARAVASLQWHDLKVRGCNSMGQTNKYNTYALQAQMCHATLHENFHSSHLTAEQL